MFTLIHGTGNRLVIFSKKEEKKGGKKKTGSGLRGGDMSVAPSYDPNLLQVTFEKPNGPIG